MVTEFWYSVTRLTVIGRPSPAETTECAVHRPGGPSSTTPRDCLAVAQVTRTDVWVRSVRYGARARPVRYGARARPVRYGALVPGRPACTPAGSASKAAAMAPTAGVRPPGRCETDTWPPRRMERMLIL